MLWVLQIFLLSMSMAVMVCLVCRGNVEYMSSAESV